MSAFKPGTRVVKVFGDVALGLLATVVDSSIDWRNAAAGCDMCIVLDGFDYSTIAPFNNHDAASRHWRPLDDNDPCADSFADVLRKLDKVSA